MTQAYVMWRGMPGKPLAVRFVSVLKEGDVFTLKIDDERTLCVVDAIVHYPVASESESEPSVGYHVELRGEKRPYRRWWFWRELISGAIGKKLT